MDKNESPIPPYLHWHLSITSIIDSKRKAFHQPILSLDNINLFFIISILENHYPIYMAKIPHCKLIHNTGNTYTHKRTKPSKLKIKKSTSFTHWGIRVDKDSNLRVHNKTVSPTILWTANLTTKLASS